MFAHNLCSFLFITEIFSKHSEVFDYRTAIHVAMIVARCESLSGDTSRIAFAGDQAYNKPHDFQQPLVINLFLDDRLRPSTDRSKFENQTKESSRYLSDITTGTLALCSTSLQSILTYLYILCCPRIERPASLLFFKHSTVYETSRDSTFKKRYLDNLQRSRRFCFSL